MSERINAFWAHLRESSDDGVRIRRRVGAIAAMSFLVCGILVSVGLAALAFTLVMCAVFSIGVLALIAVWPHLRPGAGVSVRRLRVVVSRTRAVLLPISRKAGSSTATALASGRTQGSALARGGIESAAKARAVLGPLSRKAGASTATALAAGRTHGSAFARRARESGSRATQDLAESARSTAIRFAPRPAQIDAQREALRLNAAGTQHRRSGEYDEAVECHRQALEILRTLDDRRGVALTKSNLALALSHSGEDSWAIGLFEEAAAALRDLGDEEHEAQIMANLGLAHRRHGRVDEGNNVLELALSKLSPASRAYQTVEATLRRAS